MRHTYLALLACVCAVVSCLVAPRYAGADKPTTSTIVSQQPVSGGWQDGTAKMTALTGAPDRLDDLDLYHVTSSVPQHDVIAASHRRTVQPSPVLHPDLITTFYDLSFANTSQTGMLWFAPVNTGFNVYADALAATSTTAGVTVAGGDPAESFEITAARVSTPTQAAASTDPSTPTQSATATSALPSPKASSSPAAAPSSPAAPSTQRSTVTAPATTTHPPASAPSSSTREGKATAPGSPFATGGSWLAMTGSDLAALLTLAALLIACGLAILARNRRTH